MRRISPPLSWRVVLIHCGLLLATGCPPTPLGAAELALELHELIQNDANLAAPGRAQPMAPADAQALLVSWQNAKYQSLIVIEPGGTLRRPAWVATFEQVDGILDVAYPATAFYDANGRLHIDARGARVSGELADAWSPDSFAIDLNDGSASAIDDLDWTSPGRLSERISPNEHAERFASLLAMACACVLSRM